MQDYTPFGRIGNARQAKPIIAIAAIAIAVALTLGIKPVVRLRGVSVEPLWEQVRLPLTGINWLIVGGESGPYPKPFHLEWARDVQEQCDKDGVAFFVKQLGQKPFVNGRPLILEHPHGGDWNEWPEDLRVRQFPVGFYRGAQEGVENKAA